MALTYIFSLLVCLNVLLLDVNYEMFWGSYDLQIKVLRFVIQDLREGDLQEAERRLRDLLDGT